jgi:hypothetical protein
MPLKTEAPTARALNFDFCYYYPDLWTEELCTDTLATVEGRFEAVLDACERDDNVWRAIAAANQ